MMKFCKLSICFSIFFILLFMGCGGGGSESDSSGSLPDLIIVDNNPNNTNPVDSIYVGEEVYLYIGIKNIGTSDITKSFYIKIEDDLGAVMLKLVDIDVLRAGETIYSDGEMIYFAEESDVGERTLTVTVDANDEIDESDETNNSLSESIMVLDTGESSTNENINISDIGLTKIIDRSNVFNLTISGMSNIVTVEQNNSINVLTLSGVSNTVIIEEGTVVAEFYVNGTSNDIYIPIDSNISIRDTGIGNQIIEQ